MTFSFKDIFSKCEQLSRLTVNLFTSEKKKKKKKKKSTEVSFLCNGIAYQAWILFLVHSEAATRVVL